MKSENKPEVTTPALNFKSVFVGEEKWHIDERSGKTDNCMTCHSNERPAFIIRFGADSPFVKIPGELEEDN